jgi:DNA oxidative demethylase
LGATYDLFSHPPQSTLAEGAVVLRAFACDVQEQLLECVHGILNVAPFRHMVTPGGFRMQVAMTNCGTAGWVSDHKGYRYDRIDPTTGKSWPAMPPAFALLAARAASTAGYDRFEPDSCLINRYDVKTRLSLHQDRNERDYTSPIVSVSLGLPATFLFGGLKRSESRAFRKRAESGAGDFLQSEKRVDRPKKIPLESGDVVVWGGPSRLAFHGVAALAEGVHPLTGPHRINLTFRHAL